MPSLYAPADAVNRKLRELYARDASAVNRKQRELWSRDAGAVNRKIFSGADCQGENYYSGQGIRVDGSINMNMFGPNTQYFKAIHLHFETPQTYTAGQSFAIFYGMIAYQYDNSGGTGKGPVGLRVVNLANEILYENQSFYFVTSSTQSLSTSLLSGSATDFYIWLQTMTGNWPFCFIASSFDWCGKRIQNVELI